MTAAKRITLRLAAVLLVLSLTSGTVSAEEMPNPVYSHRKNDKMMIALTFDDGPHPRYTPMILDILREYGIKATFFTVGENVSYYPDTVKRCIDEGHEIANHTYTHRDLSQDSFGDICRELLQTEDVLYENFEVHPKLFRPPGGLYSKEVINASAELDYTLVLWNIDTKDWAHTPPKDIAEKVLSTIRPGDIILMHDYIGKNTPTPDALRLFLPELINRGYKFVTVSELLGSA